MPIVAHCSRAHRRAALLAGAMFVALSAGCGPHAILDRLWPDAYWRDGQYVLVATESDAQMDLCFEQRGETFSLVGPTVYAVGADPRYVVAKQHPTSDGRHFDRTVTRYYIVERPVAPTHRRDVHVIGPLSAAEFEQFDREHDLPDFSTRFSNIEWQATGE